MAVSTRASFVETLFLSNLLSPDQFAEVPAGDDDESPRALAKQLIEKGLLTRWQAQELLKGRTQFFLGKYKLLETLGQGGMGSVFTAEHTAMHRVVALKVMSKALLKNEDAIARFQREIRSAAALNHPNIVAAYDADCVKDTYFLVMEYVAGNTMKEWVKAHGALPIEWSCECIWQAANGLQHAFERNMVHRDIKSSNLLVVPDEATAQPVVKILDMGLARFASETGRESGEITQTGQIMGSPDYIAPEQAKSAKDADIRADIFGLGCTLFELLTGRLPYLGDTVMEKLMNRAIAPAPRVSSIRPDCPPALDEIVARMLERDPKRRYQTPGEVAAALAPIKQGAHAPEGTTIIARQTDVAGGSSLPSNADETYGSALDNVASRVIEEPSFSSGSSPRIVRRKKGPDKAIWIGLGVLAVVVLLLGIFILSGGSFSSKSTKKKSRSAAAAEE